MLNGVDLSEHQTGIDYDAFAQGVDFAMVRASYGDHRIDNQGWTHRTALRSRGVPLGHYHYLLPAHSSGPVQARTFLDAVGWPVGGELLALDIEEDAEGLAFTAEMFARVVLNVAGVAPLLYTNPDFLSRYDFSALFALGCPLWVASWGIPAEDFRAPPPWNRANMHQHTSTGHLAGYNGNLDLDAFDGSRDDFFELGRIA